jgi:hypothetical protein
MQQPSLFRLFQLDFFPLGNSGPCLILCLPIATASNAAGIGTTETAWAIRPRGGDGVLSAMAC